MFESERHQSSNQEIPNNLNEYNADTLNTVGDMAGGAGASEPPMNSFEDVRDLEERREIEEHRMLIIRQQKELQNQLDALNQHLNEKSARNLPRQQIYATGNLPDRNRRH